METHELTAQTTEVKNTSLISRAADFIAWHLVVKPQIDAVIKREALEALSPRRLDLLTVNGDHPSDLRVPIPQEVPIESVTEVPEPGPISAERADG